MNEENQFIKSFNEGYILAKYKPELTELISQQIPKSNKVFEGFIEGKQQLDIEMQRNKLIEILKIRTKGRDKNISLEK
jgi:hypothetical protein